MVFASSVSRSVRLLPSSRAATVVERHLRSFEGRTDRIDRLKTEGSIHTPRNATTKGRSDV